MSDFNGAGVEVKEEARRPRKSITPGIVVAKLTGMEYGEASNENKTPYIKMTHMTAPVDGLVDENGDPMGQKATTMLWLSPKAWDNEGNPNDAQWCTKARLAIMAKKLGVEAEFNGIKATSAEDFTTQAAKLFVGKKARWVFGGEEREFTPEGETEAKLFVQPMLNTFGFVESLEDVPEDSESNLYFNKDKHIKKLVQSDDVAEDVVVEATTDSGTDEDW